MKSRARNFLLKNNALRTWRLAKWTLINDIVLWNEKIDFLKKHGKEADKKSASGSEWTLPFTYKIDKDYKQYFIHLFFCDENGDLNVWKINRIDPQKRTGQGRKANTISKSIFEEINGVSERKAFGYCDRQVIYKCIPKQLYYINENYKNKNIEHVSKADFSSHYPARLCGTMPNWNERIEVEGTIKPSIEYPFAFYIKSGHIAEYNNFDSHDWLNSPLWLQLFGDNYDPKIKENEDFTILCKASKFNYDETIKRIYESKERNEKINGMSAKIILNAAIGFKHLSNKNNKQNRLDHLAAVCIARANNLMLKNYVRGITLMIVVDSIIYKGNYEIGNKKKELGELHQEVTDASFRMRGTNQYAFMKNGKIIDFAHGGFDDNLECKRLEDIDNWRKKDIIKIGD